MNLISNEERSESARRKMTERDVELLRWIARVRFATGDQIGSRFGVHRTKAYRRVATLVRLGLVDHVNLLHGQPGVYFITRPGLKFIGENSMPVPTVSLQSFLHDRSVVWEQVQLEKSGAEVVTEREMRHLERTNDDDFVIRIPPSQTSVASTHRPDLALRVSTSGRSSWHAIEIEIARKSESRLTSILTGYLASNLYSSVVYCVPSPSLIKRIEKIGTRVGLGKRLKVVVAQDRAAA